MKQSLRVGLGFYCAGVEKSIFLYNFVFAMQVASCNVFVYQRSEIANFKSVKVNEPGRLYFDVTCRFTLHWVFGDTSNVVSDSVTSIYIITL